MNVQIYLFVPNNVTILATIIGILAAFKMAFPCEETKGIQSDSKKIWFCMKLSWLADNLWIGSHYQPTGKKEIESGNQLPTDLPAQDDDK